MFDGGRDYDTGQPDRRGGLLVLVALAAASWGVLIILVLALIGLFSPAKADVQGDARPITWARCSSSVAAGGTAQNAPLVTPSQAIRGYYLQNPDDATGQGIVTAENLYFDVSGTAAVATGVSGILVPGAAMTFGPGTIFVGAMSVNAATTGHKFICWQGM